jgi:hypothetical protein
VEKVAGRPLRISYVPNETAAAPKAAAAASNDDEVTQRALDNPEVQSFQEQFPGSQVRTVRNLKE